jgi:hypothetical protein
MSDPTHPKPGDLSINAEDLAVVNVTPEVIRSYLKFHDGVEKAISCIENLKPLDIERAGLNPATVQDTLTLLADYRRACELLPAAEKLAELIYETKMHRAHHISLNFGELATQARRRGERNANGDEILGALKDLLDYHYGPGKKAASTRAKAKAAPASQQPARPASDGTQHA